jgi:hypothetical protein
VSGEYAMVKAARRWLIDGFASRQILTDPPRGAT